MTTDVGGVVVEGEPLGVDALVPDPPVRPDTLSEDEPFDDAPGEAAVAPEPGDEFAAEGASGVAGPDWSTVPPPEVAEAVRTALGVASCETLAAVS